MAYRRKGKELHRSKSRWQSWLVANEELVPQTGVPDRIIQCHEYFDQLIEYSYSPYWDRDVVRFDIDEITAEQAPQLLKFAALTLREFEGDTDITKQALNSLRIMLNLNQNSQQDTCAP